MKLMIVESPNKIGKIGGILGSGWKIAASVGHIRDLPPNEMGVEAPDYIPKYVSTPRGAKVIKDLKELVEKADEVWIATDPDREGEAIAWHIKAALKLKSYQRVTFDGITPDVIKKAVQNPRQIDANLVFAQETRRILDRLVGFSVSPILSRKTGINGLSAGRVQSPTVRLVVDREREIKKFREVRHFGVTAFFDDKKWKAEWLTKPHLKDDETYVLDRALADRVAACRDFTVVLASSKTVAEAPPPPFTTSTMLQAASIALKFDPEIAAGHAQKLFEGGHITYHRTDSQNFNEESLAEIRAFAHGKGLALPEKPRTWKSKDGAQEAHEAIKPTHLEEEIVSDETDLQALYTLIRNRAIACQLADAQYMVITLDLESSTDQEEKVTFRAKGRVMLSPGWRSLTNGDATEDTEHKENEEEEGGTVPSLQQGNSCVACAGQVQEKKTKPPARYTKASLIKKLESSGIGRPSTYPAIMRNVMDRGYLAEKKRLLEPTDLGNLLISAMEGRFSFLDYAFTRDLEATLDKIAEGQATYKATVREVDARLKEEIELLQQAEGLSLHKCPSCGADMQRFKSKEKDEYYWVCTKSRETKCKTLPDDNGKPGKRKELAVSEHVCPACGKAKLIHRFKKGKDGYDFFGCSGFPACKASFPNEGGKPGKKKETKK